MREIHWINPSWENTEKVLKVLEVNLPLWGDDNIRIRKGDIFSDEDFKNGERLMRDMFQLYYVDLTCYCEQCGPGASEMVFSGCVGKLLKRVYLEVIGIRSLIGIGNSKGLILKIHPKTFNKENLI